MSILETIRGTGGFLADLLRVARLDLNVERGWHGLTKFMILDRLRKKTGATSFIEAGTYYGVTTARAAAVFRDVYTVELEPKLAAAARKRFANHKNVKAFEGDASKVIPQILAEQPVGQAVVFLDGHFSEGVTAHGDLAEPALEELETLLQFKDRIAAIMVDDFRAFGTEPNYPTKSQLLATAERTFGRAGYTIGLVLDELIIVRR